MKPDAKQVGQPIGVRWLDSSVQHGQVDEAELPKPAELRAVGWLSFAGDDHIVVSRDHSPSPDSFSWRSSVAIPRSHILDIGELCDASD